MLTTFLQICWVTVARILAEAIKGQTTPFPVGISWNAALQTINTNAKKLGYSIPFVGTITFDLLSATQ